VTTPAIRWQGVSLTHAGQPAPAFGPLDLTLNPGERHLLLGPSGCGKSSLIQALTGIVPASRPGRVSGRRALFGQASASRPPAAWADRVGVLMQSAEEALTGLTLWEDAAFGPESLGLPPDVIAARVTAALDRAGLSHLPPDRPTLALSGGERQRLALAGVLALEPELLVLDEPTAQLDPAAARLVHGLVADIAAPRACLVVDHRLDGLIAAIDRVTVLDASGRMLAEGEPRAIFASHREKMEAAGIWRPLAVDAAHALRQAGIDLACTPLTMAELAASLNRDETTRAAAQTWLAGRRPSPRPPVQAAPILSLRHADIAPAHGPVVLRGLSLDIHPGERIGLIGGNGAGKSSLAAVLAGLRRPHAGTRQGPPTQMVLQNPEHHVLKPSVRADLADALKSGDSATDLDTLLARWSLQDLADQHPFELSQGQKRRHSLALAEAGSRRDLWILDEPSFGLDAAATDALIAALDGLANSGRAMLLISHDMDLVARLCDRLVILGEGRILADGPADRLLMDQTLLQRAGLARPEWAALADWLVQP